MNVFIQMLASDSVDPTPDIVPTKFVVEDNIGEGIHVHLRNTRIEMSIDDFETFTENVTAAQKQLNHGDR
ncbi:hypothetical protein ACFR99_04695 [Haloarchaeobius amylolyticus]|uniref:Uncharacterized protein n=1 Tax=Haloarchaeobius amylolyticus TaxID=1198296 RepID=A0ABD6BFB8_9EURY